MINNRRKRLYKKLKKASLYCFTPDNIIKANILDIVRKEIHGGCDIIQLREKSMNKRDLLNLAYKIREITKKHNVLFFVNDDLDIAILSGADGYHTGQNDIPVNEARKIFKNGLIGLSTTSIDEYKKANELDIDYIAIGPIFPTSSKKDASTPIGIDTLKDILEYKKKLTVVIGGINRENLPNFKDLPVDMFAIISDIILDNDIVNKCNFIKEMIKNLKN